MGKRFGTSIDLQALRAELERVLASRRFRKAARTSRLLCYLAQGAVTGSRIDEFSIAAEVFGRPATFVPEIDPVVRLEFRRLRDALRFFYRGEGSHDPLLLEAGPRFQLVIWDPAQDYRKRQWRKRALPTILFATAALSAAAWWQFKPYHLDPEVLRLNQRARTLRSLGTPDDLRLSIATFQRAVGRDSRFSPAWSGLADALCSTGFTGNMSREEAMLKARDAADRAIRLDDRNAEAHSARAYVQFLQNWNWSVADAEFRRAIRLDPSAPQTHRRYAQCLLSRGHFDQAIAETRTAITLQPKDAAPSTDLVEMLISARHYDEALDEARRLVRETGGDASARIALGVCLAAEERFDEAIEVFQLAVRASGSPYAMARLGNAYGGKNDRPRAYGILNQLDEYFERTLSVYWCYRAMVYAGMGDTGRAVENLQRAYGAREGDINFVAVDPAYQRIRDDGPFLSFRSLVGLP